MSDQEQIAEVEERLMLAVKAGDVSLVEGMLDDEVQFIDCDGKVIPHSADLETYRSGRLMINNIDVCDKQISLIGNTAMVLVIDRIRGKCKGRRFEGRYMYMRVWKRKDTCWKISAASCAAVPVVEF